MSRPDWPLRAALFACLLALVGGTWVVQSLPDARAASSVATSPLRLPPEGVVHHGFRGIAGMPASNPSAGVFTGAVTMAKSGGGCGLSLGGSAPPQPVGQCTVLEIGDSLGNDIAFALRSELPPATGIRLVRLDRSETGLAKPSFYDWPAALAKALSTYHPQLVIICLGGNDQQVMAEGGALLTFPSAAWKRAYLSRVTRLATEATASGAYVLWVGLPVMQPPSYNDGVTILNSLFEEGVTAVPNAAFISTSSVLANPQGSFQASAEVDGRQAVLRSPDGIHFTETGAGVIATYLVRTMARLYDVRLVPAIPETVTRWP